MSTRGLTSPRLPHEKHFQKWPELVFFSSFWLPNRPRATVRVLRVPISKSVPNVSFFDDLTSQPLSRHSVVQILSTWISKSAPRQPVFNDFDFRTALAPQGGATLRTATSKSVRNIQSVRCGFLQTADPPRPLVFIGGLCEPAKSQKYGKHSISRSSFPPHFTHSSCITSARSHLLVDRSSAATLNIVGRSPKLPGTGSYLQGFKMSKAKISTRFPSIGSQVKVSKVSRAGVPKVPKVAKVKRRRCHNVTE